MNNQLGYKMESRNKYLRGKYSNTRCFLETVLGFQERQGSTAENAGE